MVIVKTAVAIILILIYLFIQGVVFRDAIATKDQFSSGAMSQTIFTLVLLGLAGLLLI